MRVTLTFDIDRLHRLIVREHPKADHPCCVYDRIHPGHRLLHIRALAQVTNNTLNGFVLIVTCKKKNPNK